MVGQYLSNTNKNVTVSIFPKFFGTKQALNIVVDMLVVIIARVKENGQFKGAGPIYFAVWRSHCSSKIMILTMQ